MRRPHCTNANIAVSPHRQMCRHIKHMLTLPDALCPAQDRHDSIIVVYDVFAVSELNDGNWLNIHRNRLNKQRHNFVFAPSAQDRFYELFQPCPMITQPN